MYKRILGLAVLLTAIPTVGHAQEQSAQELLLKLERKVASGKKVARQQPKIATTGNNVSDIAADLSATGIKVRSLASMNEVPPKLASESKNTPALEAALPHETLPMRELPVGSRFSFNKSVYFPANTNAKVYVDGAYKLKVYSGTFPADELFNAESGVHSACALKSSKGHVKLKGLEESTTPSFIDFREIAYVSDGDSGRYLFTMRFDEKTPANATEGVKIEVTCLIPQSMNEQIPTLKMKYLYDAFPGVFKIDIPQYVEL
jgi:hypothetical protein